MKTVEQLNKEIEQAGKDYAALEQKTQKELERLRSQVENIIGEIDRNRNEHNARVIQLQQERDAQALEEKLRTYPKKLTEGHKSCTVCGGAMRPMETAEGKYWACQFGNLQITHDLVKI